MQTIHTVGQSDELKMLRLVVPVNESNRNYDVTVTLVPAETKAIDSSGAIFPESEEADLPRMEGGILVTGKGWPKGFFENVVGALKDIPIEIGHEGDFEQRESLD